MSVTWILKIYCNLIRTGEAENDWGEYFKFQEMVLKQIRGNWYEELWRIYQSSKIKLWLLEENCISRKRKEHEIGRDYKNIEKKIYGLEKEDK